MLTALSIRNVVLIEALDLEFEPGLSVLTGETGAGKSILLDSLGLALGVRADSNLVRSGADQASVTATFEVWEASRIVATLVEESGIVIESGEPILIRRTVRADGGSRAFLNDQPCSAALLREVGTALVEIHGQHDDRGLLNPSGHRTLLDNFGRCDTGHVARAHADWRDATERLEQAREEVANAARDRDYLAHMVAELTAFAPRPGEEEALAEERTMMQRGARLVDDLAVISELFSGSEGGLAQLRQAARRLDRIACEHTLLEQALSLLDRALIDASEAEEAMEQATEALHCDPERLEAVEARLFDLRALARKHQVPADDLAALTGELAAKLTRIEAGEEGLAGLAQADTEARAAYETAARALSEERTRAAALLDEAVAAELAPLKLDTAKFHTAIEALPEAQWGPQGADRIAFEISTNPGAPFAPLSKIASGGELSRFILALKVALAQQGDAQTMIFDEIDRGVGGAVASAIGDRLARLADGGQVIVVTHSPQVAARARAHMLISKRTIQGEIRTDVRLLDDASRKEEIARMLSGADVTHEARAQAERLLEGV